MQCKPRPESPDLPKRPVYLQGGRDAVRHPTSGDRVLSHTGSESVLLDRTGPGPSKKIGPEKDTGSEALRGSPLNLEVQRPTRRLASEASRVELPLNVHHSGSEKLTMNLCFVRGKETCTDVTSTK